MHSSRTLSETVCIFIFSISGDSAGRADQNCWSSDATEDGSTAQSCFQRARGNGVRIPMFRCATAQAMNRGARQDNPQHDGIIRNICVYIYMYIYIYIYRERDSQNKLNIKINIEYQKEEYVWIRCLYNIIKFLCGQPTFSNM